MRNLILIVGLLISQQAFSQDNEIIGGVYTFEAMDKKSQGKIYVSFVISPTGEIYDDSVKAMNSIDGLEFIAEESIRNAPDWEPPSRPQRKDGSTKFVIPIKFSLDQLRNRDWSDYYLIRGEKNIALGNIDDAIADLKMSVKFNRKNAKSYFLLGNAYSKNNNQKSANKNFELAKKHGFKEDKSTK